MQTKIVLTAGAQDYRDAAACILGGGLVAFPTETVYGLGGNALDATAAKKIYAAKGRPSDNPLIIHLYDPQDAEKYCVTCPLYYRLAMAFMPGPLTVILKKKPCIPDAVTGGLDTVALRVPSHPVARAFIKEAGVPIAAPSANVSGKPSPTSVDHVINDLDGRIDMILNGGRCEIGVESTIVSIEGDGADSIIRLLRPGAVTPDMLMPFCRELVLDPCLVRPMAAGERPLAPGMKYKHYAPDADVILLDGQRDDIKAFMRAKKNDARIGLMVPEEWIEELSSDHTVSLGRGSAEEARNLFACLRYFDSLHETATIYAPLPEKEGIGLAVYNRLAKAAGFTVKNVNEESKTDKG